MNSCEYTTVLTALPHMPLPAVLCDVSVFCTVSSKPRSWRHLLRPGSTVGQSEPQENPSTKDTFIYCCSYCKNTLLQYSTIYLSTFQELWLKSQFGRPVRQCVAGPPVQSRVQVTVFVGTPLCSCEFLLHYAVS